MKMYGGEVKIIATEKFAGLKDCLTDSLALNELVGFLDKHEISGIIDLALRKLGHNTSVVIDDVSMLVTRNNYSDLFPASDFFQSVVTPIEYTFLSKDAESIDEIIHLKLKTSENIKFRFFLLLSLAVATQTNGIVSTISFDSFNKNTENEIGLYASEQWLQKIRELLMFTVK